MRNLLFLSLCGLFLWMTACQWTGRRSTSEDTTSDVLVMSTIDTLPVESPTAARLRAMGLVDITELDTTIAVHIVYATSDNFMGYVLYEDLDRAFMLPETARHLIDAQKRLRALHPDFRLVVYDAARPMSVQQKMWDRVKGTDKSIFVSNPSKGGGLHNYGAAVDVTILDAAGEPLPMGSAYDFFGDEAKITAEEKLLSDGRITREAFDNRRLLRKVMTEAGFHTITSEWWHFNLVSLEEAKQKLTLIE